VFTGLVECMGTVAAVQPVPPGVRMIIDCPRLAKTAVQGESIAVSGCCLTVVDAVGGRLAFDLGEETLGRTTLGRLRTGAPVNLERSLQLGDRLGGHLLTGHVDGLGRLAQRDDQGDWSTCWFETAAALLRQMATKGSVAVDGVSLTLVDVSDQSFSVALIPHTLSITTLGQLRVGDQVNLETDVLAKYVERQWQWARSGEGAA
jgi:riboflavin synthase